MLNTSCLTSNAAIGQNRPAASRSHWEARSVRRDACPGADRPALGDAPTQRASQGDHGASGWADHGHSTSSASLVNERNFSGATRIAAPVGQARTQAGPPSMPLHMSHLIASLACSAPAAFRLRQA